MTYRRLFYRLDVAGRCNPYRKKPFLIFRHSASIPTILSNHTKMNYTQCCESVTYWYQWYGYGWWIRYTA